MKALFELVSEERARDTRLSATKVFSDLDISKIAKSVIGRRIYKIRNTLVHQEAVSYTHLDVYKRQSFTKRIPWLN